MGLTMGLLMGEHECLSLRIACHQSTRHHDIWGEDAIDGRPLTIAQPHRGAEKQGPRPPPPLLVEAVQEKEEEPQEEDCGARPCDAEGTVNRDWDPPG
jgi:hypothetical protein